MRIIRAKQLGMCFGVRDAISLALHEAQDGPLTIFGQLVHNETVLASLEAAGIQMEHDAERIQTPNVMITAHGASSRAIQTLQARGLNIMEATCPLVHHAHHAVQRLVREKYHPVIIGKREHVEVKGLTGDLDAYDVVLTEEDVRNLAPRARFGIAAQTTQPIDKVLHLVDLIRKRFPDSEIRFEDTVCQPTKQRQMAALELARQCDAIVVVGGPNSNNTRELVSTCRQFCARVHHVEKSADLRREWFCEVQTVGITAGTSTPDEIIDAVEKWLQSHIVPEVTHASFRTGTHSDLNRPAPRASSETAEILAA